MKRATYFNYIEEKINLLATRIVSRGRLNYLELNLHSENFFLELINKIYGWSAINENENKQNAEAIDLIDHTNKYIIQVSATATKTKIEDSLSKEGISKYKDYRFKFISIARDADELKKNQFKNPHSIEFTPGDDIIDKNVILKKIQGLSLEKMEPIFQFIKSEFSNNYDDPVRLESNLAIIINILSKEDLNYSNLVSETVSFEIKRKISYNNLQNAKIIIDEYAVHYGRVDKIYAEFDSQGVNKSRSVLSTIQEEYVKAKNKLNDDELFLDIISKVQDKILCSSNYQPIPIDELGLCVNILVVDAFIRCKIFENPEKYNYAAPR